MENKISALTAVHKHRKICDLPFLFPAELNFSEQMRLCQLALNDLKERLHSDSGKHEITIECPEINITPDIPKKVRVTILVNDEFYDSIRLRLISSMFSVNSQHGFKDSMVFEPTTPQEAKLWQIYLLGSDLNL